MICIWVAKRHLCAALRLENSKIAVDGLRRFNRLDTGLHWRSFFRCPAQKHYNLHGSSTTFNQMMQMMQMMWHYTTSHCTVHKTHPFQHTELSFSSGGFLNSSRNTSSTTSMDVARRRGRSVVGVVPARHENSARLPKIRAPNFDRRFWVVPCTASLDTPKRMGRYSWKRM